MKWEDVYKFAVDEWMKNPNKASMEISNVYLSVMGLTAGEIKKRSGKEAARKYVKGYLDTIGDQVLNIVDKADIKWEEEKRKKHE
jgi:hypothetical protein